MEFRWNDWNIAHIAKHGVEPDEAERVVLRAESPCPLYRGDGKWAVLGQGEGGRYLQVVFVLDEGGTVFVIHARPLTARERKRLRRRTRR